MRRLVLPFLTLASAVFVGSAALAADPRPVCPPIVKLRVEPQRLSLDGPGCRFSLLVTGETNRGELVDLTRAATYVSRDSGLVEIGPDGVAQSVADGQSQIEVAAAGKTLAVPVRISGSHRPRSLHFENDVLPILSRFGCNSSGCHGKAEGQNGFKLSIFGFDPRADRLALLEEGRGRRIFPPAPDESLMLKKATGSVPHGGGVRILRASPEYRLLREWIAAGAPEGDPAAPRVASIRVMPRERQLRSHDSQQLRVIARYADGREVDVTSHAKFQSNREELAGVDNFGLVTAGDHPGEASVMAAYMNEVDVFRALIPLATPDSKAPAQPDSPRPQNFIDRLVAAKLDRLNVRSSALCTDDEFARRAYLDVIGTLPTPDEVRSYLSDGRADRGARLIDKLVGRPEYAEYWALRWSDLLRVDRRVLGYKEAYDYYSWIRDGFADNKPYNRFAREIITAEGLLTQVPEGALFKVDSDPGQIASSVSQIFLGVRIACAQCHHHPYDRWTQTDYYGMQACFAQVAFKPTSRGDLLASLSTVATHNPRTGEEVFAHPLATPNPKASPPGDRRRLLAAWLTRPDNPWFARCFVNRMWEHFLGRGIVEPVDDFRLTNPPSNPELLDALATDFVQHKYDVKHLIRTITAARTYRLSSEPNATNERDDENYSRALFRRLDAEVLLDAICQTTGTREKFRGIPAGSRAIELWDNESPHYFLKLFGRPVRVTACQCERSSEPSVSQVLHVLNSPNIHAKLASAAGRIARLTDRFARDPMLVDEIYLTFYSRYPSSDEREAALSYFKNAESKTGEGRRKAAEDLAWSLMNTVEFLFNH
ncbi:MAG TPA: DUF1549 and DUF1553 domain-containing protein [Planctomycetaceae bacterium]|jgi:hypothetical protein|nr:DUF1549 and DUF1553 domain-containing protein [Planctomycetaceae bacterium]